MEMRRTLPITIWIAQNLFIFFFSSKQYLRISEQMKMCFKRVTFFFLQMLTEYALYHHHFFFIDFSQRRRKKFDKRTASILTEFLILCDTGLTGSCIVAVYSSLGFSFEENVPKLTADHWWKGTIQKVNHRTCSLSKTFQNLFVLFSFQKRKNNFEHGAFHLWSDCIYRH